MGRADYLKMGEWNSICDLCGFKFKSSELRKRWDGLMADKLCYELRHPQDFLRVPREDISVPWARPQGENTFIEGNGLLTQASAQITTEDGDAISTEYS